MGIMYSIANYFGYFLFMIIFLILAIVFAKTKAAWILFAVGAGIQLLSIIGTQKSLNMWGMGSAATGYWLVYILLACVGIGLINKRKNTESYSKWKAEENAAEESTDAFRNIPPVVHGNGWQCTCGRTHADYVSACVCGVNKRDAVKKDDC